MGTAKKRRPVQQPVAAKPLAAEDVVGAPGLEIVAPEKPLRPHQCRKHLRETVAAAYRDIVAGFVAQAMSGSCQHLKMATEVVESPKRTRVGPRVKGPAERLLEELVLE
jgi:hypothetical protein